MKSLRFPLFLCCLSLLLLALSACTQQESPPAQAPQPEEITQTPDNPGGLYLTDLISMTVQEVTALWGEDIAYLDQWYGGSAKYFYYEDERVPYRFSFLDHEHKGTATGSEPLYTVGYAAWENDVVAMVAPEIPISVTYPQLEALGYQGDFSTTVGEGDEFHAGASAYFTFFYHDTIRLDFLWLEGSDCQTDPADAVTVIQADAAPEASTPQPPAGESSAAGSFEGVMGSRFVVPEGFVQRSVRPAMGYLYSFYREDLDMELSVWECSQISVPTTAEEDYNALCDSPDVEVTYATQKGNKYVVSGYQGEDIFYRVHYGGDIRYSVSFTYPKANAASCNPIVDAFMPTFSC